MGDTASKIFTVADTAQETIEKICDYAETTRSGLDAMYKILMDKAGDGNEMDKHQIQRDVEDARSKLYELEFDLRRFEECL